MRKTAVLILILLLCGMCASAKGAKEIYPGVWKITCGTPEKQVPSRYMYKKPDAEALKAQSTDHKVPAVLKGMRFTKTKRGCRIIMSMGAGEHYYGLGLNTTIFEKTNKRIILKPTDSPENKDGYSHQPVPFLVSNDGYGIFLDTARYTTWVVGSNEPFRDNAVSSDSGSADNLEELYAFRQPSGRYISVDIPAAKGVDMYIFAGDNMKNAVERYNLYSGGGVMPPLWGLGVQYRAYKEYNAKEHLELIDSIIADRIPLTMWGLEPGWLGRAYPSDFTWNTTKFPEPAGFVSQINDRRLHLVPWQHCFTHRESPLYSEMKKYSGDYLVWGGLVPDFTTKGARNLFADQMDKLLFGYEGIDGVKLDECDFQPTGEAHWSFPDMTLFPSGMDGEQMHSMLGHLYMQAVQQAQDKKQKRSWSLVRDAYAFNAPLPYNIYSDSYSYDCYVRGMAQTGFTGGLWNPEIRNASTPQDVLRRMELGVFAPLFNINIWFMKLPPWKQYDRAKNLDGIILDNADELTEASRKISCMRMSFVPYMYSAFMDYHTKGTPPVRALVMDYPLDPNVWKIDDEFLAGDRILVAPCVRERTTREIYFPAGDDWADYYTGTVYKGGTRTTLDYPLDTLPVFVKNNSILPVAEPEMNILPDTVFRITNKVYGNGERGFILYEDDGESYDFEKGLINRIELTCRDGRVSADRKGNFPGRRYEFE